jgi:hypothetical protein
MTGCDTHSASAAIKPAAATAHYREFEKTKGMFQQ